MEVADLGDPVPIESPVEPRQDERDGDDLHVLRLDLSRVVDGTAQERAAEYHPEQGSPVCYAPVHTQPV